MNKSTIRQFLSIVFASFIFIIVTSAFSSAIAQDNESDSFNIAPVEIPFNEELDQPSKIIGDSEQSPPLSESERAVVGQDERYPVLSRQYPWSAIGRLEWLDRGQLTSTCTATLIAPDAILTNSHCLTYSRYNSETRSYDSLFLEPEQYSRLLALDNGQSRMVFKPNMIEGRFLESANVIGYESGWTSSSQNPANDWAVLKLDAPIGNSEGYLGWRNLDFTDSNIISNVFEKIHLLGYAGDFPTSSLREFGQPTETAGIDIACSVLGVWPSGSPHAGTLAHDCDTNPGASGGPILALFSDSNYYIVGLHAQSTRVPNTTLPNGVRTNVVNGGVQTSRWTSAAVRARN